MFGVVVIVISYTNKMYLHRYKLNLIWHIAYISLSNRKEKPIEGLAHHYCVSITNAQAPESQ